MHLKQPRFTYRASRLFIKNKDETFKRTASDKVLYVIKHFILLKIKNMMNIKLDFLQ